jgi:hypothetical protein
MQKGTKEEERKKGEEPEEGRKKGEGEWKT